MKKRGSKGFTLIEVLTAMAIAMIAVAALAALLMGAGRVIRFLDSRNEAQWIDALIAIERMKKELQESPVYPAVAFEGKSNRVSFPKLKKTASNGEVFGKEFILGQVQQMTLGGAFKYEKAEYVFDKSKGALVRKEEGGADDAVISGLEDCQFFYAVGSLEDGSKKWESQTPPQGAAARLYGMEIRMKLKQEAGIPPPPAIRKTFIFYREHPLNAIPEASK